MTTTRRSRTISKVGAGAAGLGLAAIAVLGFSNAAFHAETDNAGNNWATEGFVSMDDDLSAPLFSAGVDGAPKPYTGEYDSEIAVGEGIADREITVNYGGRAEADVRMLVSPDYQATKGLDTDTTLAIERDGTQIYQGTLADMPTTYAEAGNGWRVGPEADSATYTVSIDTAPTTQDGATLTDVEFVWVAEQAG